MLGLAEEREELVGGMGSRWHGVRTSLEILSDEAKLEGIADRDCEEEGNDGPPGVAHAPANRLNYKDGEEDSKTEKEAVGNEVARGSRSEGSGGPMQIKRVQEATDREDGQKE